MPSTVQKLFADVPSTYERINHLLTWNFDRLWRKKAVQWAIGGGGARWVDVCSGTGETAAALARLAPQGTTVLALDFSLPMLGEIDKKPEAGRLIRVGANVRALPMADNSIDLITLSFGTRNINTSRPALIQALREFHRVLKPGGRFVNVETSQPRNRLIRWGFHRYIAVAVKPLGAAVSGSKAAYAYLSHTIPRWYHAEELNTLLLEAGFTKVNHQPLLFGVAAIHHAVK